MARKKKEIVISTARPERKKIVPKTAFKKGQPNPHAFKPGESGRTRKKEDARPDDERLIGRVLRRRLGDRAPDAHAKAVGLKAGASWAMVLGEALLLKASEGDVQAIREVSERSEGGRAFGIGIQIGGDAGEPGSESTPLLNVSFISAEFANADADRTTITDEDGHSRVYVDGRLVEEKRPRPALIEATLPPPVSETAPEVHAEAPEAPPAHSSALARLISSGTPTTAPTKPKELQPGENPAWEHPAIPASNRFHRRR